MPPLSQTRRRFLITSAMVGSAIAAPAKAGAKSDTFSFEVTRTETEWRAMLTEEQFSVMREGATELPQNGTLWKDYSAGEFLCRGCDLHVYSSDWRVELDKGWIFFAHSQPDAVMMGIDYAKDTSMDDSDERTLIETHCRRCASHLGHIVYVDEQLVHCINAASIVRVPQTT